MRRYHRADQSLAVALAVLAGFVDALGFLDLNGLFVSFMSGNSTRMAVGAVTGVHRAGVTGGLIAAFVVGVMVATAAGARWHRRRAALVLGIACVLLVLAAIAGGVPGDWGFGDWNFGDRGIGVRASDGSLVRTLLMAAAMGAANAVFQRDGEVSVGVTYMTGTLVKLAQHLTAALSGGPRLGWLPYLLLWCGLVGGAAAGAQAYGRYGGAAAWIAAGYAALLAAIATRR